MHTKKSILGVVFVICSLYSNAQKSFDEVFDGIRTEVFDGDRSLGKSQLELFVKKYPKSIDARLFLSRVYAWGKTVWKSQKTLEYWI